MDDASRESGSYTPDMIIYYDVLKQVKKRNTCSFVITTSGSNTWTDASANGLPLTQAVLEVSRKFRTKMEAAPGGL